MSSSTATKPRTFHCVMCHGTFQCGLTEQQAIEQFAREFPGEPLPSEDTNERVCDECYNSPEMQAIIAAGPCGVDQ